MTGTLAIQKKKGHLETEVYNQNHIKQCFLDVKTVLFVLVKIETQKEDSFKLKAFCRLKR